MVTIVTSRGVPPVVGRTPGASVLGSAGRHLGVVAEASGLRLMRRLHAVEQASVGVTGRRGTCRPGEGDKWPGWAGNGAILVERRSRRELAADAIRTVFRWQPQRRHRLVACIFRKAGERGARTWKICRLIYRETANARTCSGRLHASRKAALSLTIRLRMAVWASVTIRMS